MTATGGTLFDDSFLAHLEHLRLVSKRLQPAGMRGEHRIRQLGSGIELADYRPYVPGDDIRALDQGAWLRLDKLLVRLFEEEGDLSIYLLVDVSRSMAEGGHEKLDLARRLAAALGYVALSNHDRVTAVGFAESIGSRLVTLRGRDSVWRLMRFLEDLEPSSATGDGTALDRIVSQLFSTPRRRGLVIPISDFLDPQWESAMRHLAALRQDVLMLHVTSPTDVPADLPREAVLIDAEDRGTQRLRVTDRAMNAYRARLDDHRSSLESAAKRYGWSFVDASTEVGIDEQLLQIFRLGRLVR